jgi:hypothetical protein
MVSVRIDYAPCGGGDSVSGDHAEFSCINVRYRTEYNIAFVCKLFRSGHSKQAQQELGPSMRRMTE